MKRRHNIRRAAAPTLITTTPRVIPEYTLDTGPRDPLQMEAVGNRPGTILIWQVADGHALPPGMYLSVDGVLSGTPTVAGEYLFGIECAEVPDGL